MITLECDNRLIVQGAKYSYLSSSIASGVTSFSLTNATDFAINVGNPTMNLSTPAACTVTLANHGLKANDIIFFTTTGALYSGITANQAYYVSATNLTTNTFEFSSTGSLPNVITTGTQSGTHTVYKINSIYLLLGNIGSESAEIVKISTINTSTGAITISVATKFGHAESTRVTAIPYNQVAFYWTATETFAMTTPVPNALATTYIDLQVSDWFTTVDDDDHTTGYGWYAFHNATTLVDSVASNSLPYAGFESDTVEDVLNDFYSLLNNKELKLVTRRDALSWMNEGISIIRNKLNMTNVEYTASELSSLSIVSGTTEYSLPSDFSRLISITSSESGLSLLASGNFNKDSIDYISLREAPAYTGSETRYYIRGKYIGFVPTPETSTTYYYMYLTKSTRLNSNSDEIDLPDNGFYSIKDWMMYRACMKFRSQSEAMTYYKMFQDNMNQMIISSVDRDANLDSFSIDGSANC